MKAPKQVIVERLEGWFKGIELLEPKTGDLAEQILADLALEGYAFMAIGGN